MKRPLFFLFIFSATLFNFQLYGSESSDTLIVGYTSAPPFIIDDPDHLYGINIWLWDRIAADLQIPFKLKKKPFGELLTGLNDGSIDICINPLTMTAERSTRFHFTSPFFVSSDTAVMKKKGRLASLRLILLTFFSWDFLGTLLLLIVTISFFGILTWFFERRKNPEQFRPGLQGLWDGLWWSTVTLTTVGYGDKSPKSPGGKVVALVWMFAALIFLSGLTASIASVLLKERKSINSMTEADLRELKVATVEGTSSEHFLKRRFFSHIFTVNSLMDGFKLVEEKEVEALIYDEPILKYRIKEFPSKSLEVLPFKFNLQLYAFGLSEEQLELQSSISERILYHTATTDWQLLLGEYELQAR